MALICCLKHIFPLYLHPRVLPAGTKNLYQLRTVITGTGCYIPSEVKTNSEFTVHHFYGEDHEPIPTPQHEVVEKFKQITGIIERRYVSSNLTASDIGAITFPENGLAQFDDTNPPASSAFYRTITID